MLKYFQVKKQKGSTKKSVIFRERSKKYSKKINETYIKKTLSLIIVGSHASGKTKELNKIYKESINIYKQQTAIYISAIDPFSDWYNKNIRKKDIDNFINTLEENEKDEVMEDIKKQHIKIQSLINKTQGAILYVDDIDKMNGKKKEITKDLVSVASIIICTAKDTNGIDKTIQNMLFNKGYEEIILMSDVSYDATNTIFIMMILGMFATGMHEVALLIMAGRYVLKGNDKK